MKITCNKCYGNKTYRGMGAMMIKCEPCNGLGQVDIEVKLEEVKSEPAKIVRKEKRNAKEKGDGKEERI